MKKVKPNPVVLQKHEEEARKNQPHIRRKVEISQQRLELAAKKLEKASGIHNFSRLEKLAAGSKHARGMIERGEPQDKIIQFLRVQVGDEEARIIARNLWPQPAEGKFDQKRRDEIARAIQIKNRLLTNKISEDEFLHHTNVFTEREVMKMLLEEKPEILMMLRNTHPRLYKMVIGGLK